MPKPQCCYADLEASREIYRKSNLRSGLDIPRPIPCCIKLTKGYKALVDAEDFKYLNQFTWKVSIRGDGTIAYAFRQEYNKGVTISVWMHKLIMGVGKEFIVDHRDNNIFNNQKHNLRPCTHKQNMGNKSKRKDSKGKYKGITLRGSKWVAKLKNKYLGSFNTQAKAAKMYDKYAFKFYGVFAKLNFPKNLQRTKTLVHSPLSVSLTP